MLIVGETWCDKNPLSIQSQSSMSWVLIFGSYVELGLKYIVSYLMKYVTPLYLDSCFGNVPSAVALVLKGSMQSFLLRSMHIIKSICKHRMQGKEVKTVRMQKGMYTIWYKVD